jgi:hypothetical protein
MDIHYVAKVAAFGGSRTLLKGASEIYSQSIQRKAGPQSSSGACPGGCWRFPVLGLGCPPIAVALVLSFIDHHRAL